MKLFMPALHIREEVLRIYIENFAHAFRVNEEYNKQFLVDMAVRRSDAAKRGWIARRANKK